MSPGQHDLLVSQPPNNLPSPSPGRATPHPPGPNPAPKLPTAGRPTPSAAIPGTNPSAGLPAPAGRTWPIVILRLLSVLILLQVLTQAALAGGFITGNVKLLGLHSANGIALTLTTSALLPAAILLVRPGRGPWWPIAFSILMWWLVTLQIGFGFARQVGLHIPLGVAIMSLISGFTWWSIAHRGPSRSNDRVRRAAA